MHIAKYAQPLLLLALCILAAQHSTSASHYSKEKMIELREKVRSMFQHAYEGYLRYASDYDELRPLTCDGIDTWGSYSLTLIDALDTLATMGNYSEFRRVALLLESKMDFDRDINVSVFETNIRIVGGLLSAHLLSKRAGLTLEEGWPCAGPLLRMAEDVARRLLPAFDTATGMPYGTVNLRYGVPKGETPITCTAGVGTFLVEFGALSRLTGNPVFEEVAIQALHGLWERRSPIGLFGNHIDVQTGRWTALDAGIGAGVDSYFEYLVKGAIMLNRPDLLEMFHDARHSIDKYLKRDDWYVWAGMNKGQVTLPVFQSLEAFWPGLLSLIGDIAPAMRTMTKYSSVWRKYGFLPEFYNIPTAEASPNRESYPLRPELAESAMYLYRATKNQMLLEVGESMLESIEFSAKTKCGYATIRNVVTHEKENRMESFFLSETTKYLYLLFDADNFMHNNAGTGELLQTPNGECVVNAGAYIFNTEAHPIDMSALYCCHDIHENIYDGLDLDIFSDEALLKVAQETRRAEAAASTKYQCADSSSTGEQKSGKPVNQVVGSAAAKSTEVKLTVDIEVFDEENNPADDVLIESFERITLERQLSAAMENKAVARNQLTVTDLDEFFVVTRDQFTDADKALDYVVSFMRNFTLDAGFISGLQLFNKNLTTTLGAAIQKEYEGQTRSLWDLYKLQQQYTINADLIKQLGLVTFDDENVELLDNVLKALNYNTATDTAAEEEVPIQIILQRIDASRLQFENALVNTTAMQEFLLKILINGTTEKKRSFKLLLDDKEISTLTAPHTATHKLFDNLRKVVEFKKRMIETFDKLQKLMQDSNVVAGTTPSSSKSIKSKSAKAVNDDDLVVATPKKENDKAAKTSAAHENETKPEISESVWSQLVQTILRKTTLQRTKFDEELLLQKTRDAMQKYTHKPMRHELFTCQRPKFIEKFSYLDFHHPQ